MGFYSLVPGNHLEATLTLDLLGTRLVCLESLGLLLTLREVGNLLLHLLKFGFHSYVFTLKFC